MSCDAEVEDKTFTFEQLSPRAKEKAREKWRSTALYHDWWMDVYEDAVRIGKLLGLEVETRYERGPRKLNEYESPDIRFSGFCSQGDGCCWSGHIVTQDLNGAVERVKAECGTSDEDLLALAKQAETLYGEIAVIAAMQRLLPADEDPEWPEVTFDMRLAVTGTERSYSTRVDDNLIPDDLAKTANSYVEYFADWIYTQLENEYEHLLSDEVIDEAIDNACLTFDEDGNEQ